MFIVKNIYAIYLHERQKHVEFRTSRFCLMSLVVSPFKHSP
jgi:hypothetical protein